MPREPALLTSGAMDGGAKSASSERRPRRAAANVRRRGMGSPERRGSYVQVDNLHLRVGRRLDFRRLPVTIVAGRDVERTQ